MAVPLLCCRLAALRAATAPWARWFEHARIFALVPWPRPRCCSACCVLELRDKLALKGDLEIARQIQFGLLPFEPFHRNGTSICAAMRPANTVGGDYFDIIDLGDGPRLAVVMGDVAGKGMPAALLMALLQGSLRTLLERRLARRPTLIAKLNAHLYANIPSNRLVTLFYGELDHGDRARCATSTPATTRRSCCARTA